MGDTGTHWRIVEEAERWARGEQAVEALRSRVFQALTTALDNGYTLGAEDANGWAEDLQSYSSALEDVPGWVLAVFVQEFMDQQRAEEGA